MFKKSNHNREAILYPALGAIALLEASKKDAGLNVASAFRAERWCWSTYDYLYEHLSDQDIVELDKVMKKLKRLLKKAPKWVAEDKLRDGWDDDHVVADNCYEEHRDWRN